MSSSGKTEAVSLTLRVLRRESSDSKPYLQEIPYSSQDGKDTVAGALTKINEGGYKDSEGKTVTEIKWQCSCLQKKCGSCAMIIDGRPRLACDAFLSEFSGKKVLTIEPLRKFPCVADLIVDRSIMMKNLLEMEIWAEQEINLKEKKLPAVYDASRCLQCGCCLEVCPNFAPDEKFFGAAGFVPSSRLIASVDKSESKRILKEYNRHAYSGCGKSLSCKNICPAGIDIEKLLVKSNAAAFWGRHGK